MNTVGNEVAKMVRIYKLNKILNKKKILKNLNSTTSHPSSSLTMALACGAIIVAIILTYHKKFLQMIL
jgi:hypothetical protein